jgi:hypothetical protein
LCKKPTIVLHENGNTSFRRNPRQIASSRWSLDPFNRGVACMVGTV